MPQQTENETQRLEDVEYTPLNASGSIAEDKAGQLEAPFENGNLRPTAPVAPAAQQTVLDDGNSAQRREKARPGWKHLLSQWTLEIVACIVAVAALLAVVGTLIPYQGKPSPQWPHEISINTLLAIYTRVLQAGMVVVLGSSMGQLKWSWFASERLLMDLARYDAARTGTWGSLRWLWTYRLRQPLMAFGVAVAVLSVAIDPFMQQLLSYYDCSTALGSGASASLPRTAYYQSRGIVSGGALAVVDPAVQAAVKAGYVGSPYTTGADCSTGNCTFPQPYSTVGYCARCDDVSDAIQIVSQECWHSFSDDTNASVNGSVCYANSTSSIITTRLNTNSTSAHYGTPSDLLVTWDDTLASFGSTTVAAAQTVASGAPWQLNQAGYIWTQVLFGKTLAAVQHVDPIAGNPVAGCNSDNNNGNWQCRGYGAAQCALRPCVREYRATVAAGQLQETLVDSSDIDVPWGLGDLTHDSDGTADGGGTLAVVDLRCATPAQTALLQQRGYDTVSNSSRWLPYNVSDGFHANPAADPLAPCVSAVDLRFAQDLWTVYLDDAFGGNLTALISFVGNVSSAQYLVSVVDGPEVLQAVFNWGNLSYAGVAAVFANMSDSMTAHIRTAGVAGTSSTPATGEVLHSAACLAVTWPWLTLPAALVLLAVLFLALTVVATRDQVLWKESSLAMVFHGPENASEEYERLWRKEGEPPNAVEAMEEAAKKLRMKPEGPGNNFKLVPA